MARVIFMKQKLPIIIVLLVLAGFGAAYIFIPKTYPIYGEAIQLAKEDDRVKSILGTHIKEDVFVYSKISPGSALIEVGLNGSAGTGELLIYGSKKNNVWKLDSVFFNSSVLPKRYVVYSK